MLSNKILGKLERFKGFLIESWGHLVNDEIKIATGRQLKFFGKALEKYGLTKEAVKHGHAKFVEESKGAGKAAVKY